MLMRVQRRPTRRSAVHRAGRVVAAVAAAGLPFAIACDDQVTAPAPVVRPVKILEVDSGATALKLEYPGQIRPATNAEVGFEVAGKLVDFPVRESQRVEKGDVLARLDPRDYEADRDAAAAHAAAMKAEFSRSDVLFKENVTSKQELERAQRNYEVAVTRVQKADKAVEDAVLRAPFAGIVARRLVNDFDNVQAKQPIVQLQTGSALEIVVNLPEQDFGRIRPGLTIEERNRDLDAVVFVSAIPDRGFPAKLKEFATTADPKTRTFAVTFSFEVPSDVSVMPGMTARLVVRSRAAAGRQTIPVQAVLAAETEQPFVWSVDPESMRVSRTPIELGELTGSSVEVRAGLEGGGLIVLSGVHQLREGMEVRRIDE